MKILKTKILVNTTKLFKGKVARDFGTTLTRTNAKVGNTT